MFRVGCGQTECGGTGPGWRRGSAEWWKWGSWRGNDRWEAGAAIKQWRRLRRPEAAATAVTAGKRH